MEVQRALSRGECFLATTQERDGSFASFSSPQKAPFQADKKHFTTFLNALVLSCLQSLPRTPTLQTVTSRLANFLSAQRSKNWSFNYWDRRSIEAKAQPYPDDFDDTACALAALFGQNARLFEDAGLAKLTTLLTQNEAAEGGPYYTWIGTKDPIWRDVDLAVNSNIAFLLLRLGVKLDSLTKLQDQAIRQQRYVSRYYPSAYPIIYFLARSYSGRQQTRVISFLRTRQEPNGSWGTPLVTALAVSALLNLDSGPSKLESAVSYLLSTEQNGSWPAEAFCCDPAKNGQPYYAGAAALSTAFCLAALRQYSEAADQPGRGRRFANEPDRSSQAIALVTKRVKSAPGSLRQPLQASVRKLLGHESSQEIRRLPYLFAESLGDRSRELSASFLAELSAANVWGWLAYTIYDDFLDGEGRAPALPLANLALRELCRLYDALPLNQDFFKLFHQRFDRLEAANYREVVNHRFAPAEFAALPKPGRPNWSALADKSFGHAFGPLAILSRLGRSAWSEHEKIAQFFEHYLIARQLNDDLHDWEEDLLGGRINPVGAILLNEVPRPKTASLAEFTPLLRRHFWQTSSPKICRRVLTEVRHARLILENSPIIRQPQTWEQLLQRLEQPAEKVLTEQAQTRHLAELYYTPS